MSRVLNVRSQIIFKIDSRKKDLTQVSHPEQCLISYLVSHIAIKYAWDNFGFMRYFHTIIMSYVLYCCTINHGK